MIVADLEGTITDCTPAFEQRFGYQPAELVGRSVDIFAVALASVSDERPLALLQRVRSSGLTREYDGTRAGKDGKPIHVHGWIEPLRDVDGVLVGTLEHVLPDDVAPDARQRDHDDGFRAALFSGNAIAWSAKSPGRIEHDIPAWRAFTGQTLEQMLGEGWLTAVHPDDRARLHVLGRKRDPNAVVYFENEWRLRRYDGALRDMFCRGVFVRCANSDASAWIVTCWDVTSVREFRAGVVTSRTRAEVHAARISALWDIANAALDADEQWNAVLLTATAAIRPNRPMLGTLSHLEIDGTIVIDATSWSDADEGARSLAAGVFPGARFLLGETMQSALVSQPGARSWNNLLAYDGCGMLCERVGWRSFIGAPFTAQRESHFVSFTSMASMDGEPFDDDDRSYVDLVSSYFANQFVQRIQRQRIQYEIAHDPLTDLVNRSSFRSVLRTAIAAGNPFTIAFVGLDGFRLVNEAYGYLLGDEALVEVGVELRLAAGDNLAARMSGDEFALFIDGSSEQAAVILKRCFDRFALPFHTGDRDGARMLPLSASFGVAHFPTDAASAEDIMREADIALRVAKASGGAMMMRFEKSMASIATETYARIAEISAAISGDQLALAYQPTFDLLTRKTVGAEALVRWDHPERGRLAPFEFVPFSERHHLIAPLTRWVFERLVKDLLAQPLPASIRVYFNLASAMLTDVPFITSVGEMLAAQPQLRGAIGIEITETTAMQNVERAMSTIDLFRGWGLHVAIDDFGTGYSSLSYLKELEVDVIKIDKSFVDGVPGEPRDLALLELLLRISEQFGLTSLAEGIETEAQLAWLVRHGCRLGQGFLIAKPQPYGEFLRFAEASVSA